MGKKYSSVTDMLQGLGVNQELVNSTMKEIEGRRLITDLMALRAAKGMSQSDVATVIGCSQSRISKLENGEDTDLRLGDFNDYAKAIGCEVHVGIMQNDLKAAAQVKMHAREIKKNLDHMLQLAGDDDKIAEGVSQFLVEAFVNLTMIVAHSAQKLPKKPDGTPYCEVMFESGFIESPAAKTSHKNKCETDAKNHCSAS